MAIVKDIESLITRINKAMEKMDPYESHTAFLKGQSAGLRDALDILKKHHCTSNDVPRES